MKVAEYENWTGRDWAEKLRRNSGLVEECDWGKLTADDWLYLLGHCPNNGEIVSQCDKWESFPVDRVCDLLREHPQLIGSCPDAVWLKFRLGHQAKLIREASQKSNYPAIASHEGRLAVVDKMKKLGVVGRMISDWCCPFHWAEEYGSVYHAFRAAATPAEQKIKYIAENSALNPYGSFLGRGGHFHADIPKHISWLASLAADFAAMAAEAAKTAPEYGYAEEYANIAQAAEYEIQILFPEQQPHNSNGVGCIHSLAGEQGK